MTENTEIIEKLASLEHEQWAHWTKYMLDVLAPLFGNEIMTENQIRMLYAVMPAEGLAADHITRTRKAFEAVDRWRRQIDTPYSDLTEKEKDSDREWAEKAFDTARGVESSIWVHECDVVPERLKRLTEDAIMVERGRVSSILSDLMQKAMEKRDGPAMDAITALQEALETKEPS